MERGSLSDWLRAWRGADPGFRLEDFTGIRSRVERFLEQAEPDALTFPSLRRKMARGLLLRSPDGGWWLDPEGDMELDARGRAGYDVDAAANLYENPPGKRSLRHTFGSHGGSWWGAWLSQEDFALAGAVTAFHPDGLEYELPAPAVWIGNVRTAELRSYMGKPCRPPISREASRVVREAVRARRPAVRR
jgi:hypothetical protein